MSQRAPSKAGTALLKVTRPMTLPSLIMEKPQIPSSKLRRSSPSQAQRFYGVCMSLRLCKFPLGASFEFGTWCLELSFLFLFIYDANDHPTHGTFGIVNRITRSSAIG